jgi:hypothetical protein
MSLLRRLRKAEAVDRRALPRQRVQLAASLLMASGTRRGQLLDMSQAGARLESDEAPPKGCAALLEWTLWDGSRCEAYCKVAWTQGGICGLEFEKLLPKTVFDRSVAPVPRTGPRTFGQRTTGFG